MQSASLEQLESLARFFRYWSLRMCTLAGSGHPTSALSAADLMAAFWASLYRFDFSHPENPNNDRLIFSKGHASPLFYALFAASGVLTPEELERFRTIDSPLEGHPTFRFPYTEAATGSLGQGLSIGLGMALSARYLERRPYRVFVLLGDGEMAEGSVWEAIALASHYRLDNLVAILDVNRLGQSGPTMLGHHTEDYQCRVEAFGWETRVIDGHRFEEILEAYRRVEESRDRPYMIIARTRKGKGISFLEDQEGWHGKPLPPELLEQALQELDPVVPRFRIQVQVPPSESPASPPRGEVPRSLPYRLGERIPTRKAYGQALVRLGEAYPEIVVLDGDVKNSTYTERFQARFPDRFFEMFIAEQNMVGAAVGLARRGYIPFVSTFAAFLTRAFDQIRMANLSQVGIKFCGSHAGVAIGADGPSQMGLEDLALFRSILGCVVLYPSDAISTERLVEAMVQHPGMAYIRTTRNPTPVIYDADTPFVIGGSRVHLPPEGSASPRAVVVAAGITLHEALQAQKALAVEGIPVTVVDCYSIRPLDRDTLLPLGRQAGLVLTVEDHWIDGGLGDAILNVFAEEPDVRVIKLAVHTLPRSGKPEELLALQGIDAAHIADTVRKQVR